MVEIIITKDNKHYAYNNSKYCSYELDDYKYAVVLDVIVKEMIVKEIIGFGKIEENAILNGKAYKLLKDEWDY